MTSSSARPPFDQWLSHRPRDRRGLPVPYINLWGTPAEETTRVAHDPRVGRDSIYFDDAGDIPNFTKQAPQRQRECMIDGLCQVCARPVPWSRRNLIITAAAVEWVTLDPGQLAGRVPVISEPWLDDRCAAIATAWCPALIRAHRAGGLTVAPVHTRRDVTLVLSTGWVSGPFETRTRTHQAGMFVKAHLKGHRIVPASQSGTGHRDVPHHPGGTPPWT